jgi:hypothetical protein
MKNFKAHLDLLGFKVKDKVTGASGVVSSVSFDLYGCIQAVVSPPATPEGEPKEGRWYDIARLEIIDPKPVMAAPKFFDDSTRTAKGERGPAEKPARF